MSFVKFPVLALCMGLALSAHAADRRRSSEPPPLPPQFRVDVATRSMDLTRVMLGISTGTTIGEMAPTCTLIGAEGYRRVVLYPQHAFSTSYVRDFKGIFAEQAQAAGYRVSHEVGNMFEEQGASKAELAVGAGITALTANGCTGAVLIVKMQEANVSMTIDWQVFDPLEKKLLFRGSTTGSGHIKNNSPNDTIVMEGTRAAFQDAARQILSDPNFVAAVTDHRAGATTAPAATTNELFPEATQTPSAAIPQIPRLPLRTRAFSEQVEELRGQVVTVLTGSGSGSGFYIADGLLLTNNHVVDGVQHVKIRFFGGKEIPGEVVSTNAKRDVALLKTEPVGLPGLPLRLEKPEITARTFVIGSPLGQENEGSVISGIVSAFRDSEQGPFIQSDVPVTHGNSGGPMFDDRGNVIALVVSGKHGQDGVAVAINLFIPVDDALKALKIDFAPTATAAKATSR